MPRHADISPNHRLMYMYLPGRRMGLFMHPPYSKCKCTKLKFHQIVVWLESIFYIELDSTLKQWMGRTGLGWRAHLHYVCTGYQLMTKTILSTQRTLHVDIFTTWLAQCPAQTCFFFIMQYFKYHLLFRESSDSGRGLVRNFLQKKQDELHPSFLVEGHIIRSYNRLLDC